MAKKPIKTKAKPKMSLEDQIRVVDLGINDRLIIDWVPEDQKNELGSLILELQGEVSNDGKQRRIYDLYLEYACLDDLEAIAKALLEIHRNGRVKG